MATSVANISSGIYYKEIDLTIITQSVGTFAGAMIGMTEKGPAFQVVTSASFLERQNRLGGLNASMDSNGKLLYPSSYYAREFLEQANNYKEVRVLGLEGYNEIPATLPSPALPGTHDDSTGFDKSFAIMYDVAGTSARTIPNLVPPFTPPSLPSDGIGPFDNPVIASMQSVAAILKPRRVNYTQAPEVIWVEVANTTQRDGTTGYATDDLFNVIIHYTDSSLDLIVPCSLRPSAKEYIGKVFGTNPRDLAKVQGRTSPLWADFIYDSVAVKTTPTATATYYYPGTLTTGSFTGTLDMVKGDVTIQTQFTYPSVAITITGSNAAGTLSSNIINGTQITFAGTGLTITNITGTPSLDGYTVYAGNVVANTSCNIYLDAALTTLATLSAGGSGTVRQAFTATWEKEVMTLGGKTEDLAILFQTPITPWFVSDADVNGDVQRLFRLWSISDGDNANIEIKVEVSNINPDGNLGYGSFDIYVRQFSDREDQQRKVIEAFTNLTLNPKSDNFIARRLGDGEIFPLQSAYIFCELNTNDELPSNALPYGIEGYVDSTGTVFPDVIWTSGYDFTKSLTKQMLGLANNATNMFSPITFEYLSYKEVSNLSAATGKGFHLNPHNNLLINTALFTVADQAIYQINPPTNLTLVSGVEKTKRSKYVVAFAGGFDAFDVYSERAWGDTTSKDFEALTLAIDVLSDQESLEVDFSVLVTPDINFEDHSSATELVLEMVTGRGDALYIPDFRYSLESIPDAAKLALQSSNMKSNYSAIYFPHVQIEDNTNKTNVWLPPSIIALATIAATATNEQVWQPPAGSLRTVTSNLVRMRRRMRLGDREILKSANINPITLFPGSGFEITESRTTQEFLSALSFVHNRLLLGYAKKTLNQTLRPILHQLNTVSLRNAFVNTITPVFERIKKLNGLEDFSVSVIDDVNDRTTLNGVITIVPLYPVEKIIISFVLQNGSLSFNQ